MKYGVIDTAIGTVIVAATERGVCSVDLKTPEKRFRAAHPDGVHDPSAVAQPLRLLRRYFEGEPVSFDALELDLSAGSALQQAVWRAICGVPRGTTISYAKLAARVGRPAAWRAVGTIVGQNPIPIIVPCHRIIRSGGSLGNYGGGVAMKRFLLEKLEKAKKKRKR